MDTSEIKYLEKKIIKSLEELNTEFIKIKEYEEESRYGEPEGFSWYEHDVAIDSFKSLAESIYKLFLVYFETKKLEHLILHFKEELLPFIKDGSKIVSSYDNPYDIEYSTLNYLFGSYLIAFPAFDDIGYEGFLKQTGLHYLENILISTKVLIKEQGKMPKKEADVYNAIKPFIEAVFPNATLKTQPFQKLGKCYNPDILVPSLNCAIEYKYATEKKTLVETIDQILTDVQGYSKHPLYKLFYAVFYVESGVCTKESFDEIWKEREFPKNWTGIIVL